MVVPFMSKAPLVVSPAIVPRLVMFGCAAVLKVPFTSPPEP